MSLLTFNDATTMKSTVTFAEETMVNVQGKGVRAISIPVVGTLEEIKQNFTDTLKTAKITLTDEEDTNLVNTYDGYTHLVSISYVAGEEDAFKVTLSLSVDIETFVNSVSKTIDDLKAIAKATSDTIANHDEAISSTSKSLEETTQNFNSFTESFGEFSKANTEKIETIEKSIGDNNNYIRTVSEVLDEFNTSTVPALNEKIETVEASVKAITEEPNMSNMTLGEAKKYLTGISKQLLEEYLASHPITSSCHGGEEKQYSITSEKQQYLSMMVLMTTMAIEKDIPYTPSWNATGEACTYDWTLDELQQLAIEIETVVRPLVSKQQNYEKQIEVCTSIEELQSIVITYA